ncbi:MAG: primosomal protein N' [Tannerella sp.]|jgi:primosomal protein N' (replication factor Y)|nr:primosomal protein N' [Tannerella sp.]
MKYVDVILPLSLEDTYTYRVPEEMEASVRANFRVVVPFGKRRYYTAIVKEVHERVPENIHALKDIFALPDEMPIIFPRQLSFWEWMASYYLCKLGDVYRAAVPSGLKLESETVVSRIEEAVAEVSLSSREQVVMDAINSDDALSVASLEKKTGLRHVITALNSLVRKGVITVGEELRRGSTPKMERFIRLASEYAHEEALLSILNRLKRAKQQEKLLLTFLDRVQPFPSSPDGGIAGKELLQVADVTNATLNALLKRGILTVYEKRIDRPASTVGTLHPLTAAQQRACEEIRSVFAEKSVCLLHGVPSCGKTEIYLHLAMETLRQGRQVLYLLPEIAVTTQITTRLANILGTRLLIYHSGFSDRERVDVWNHLLQNREPVLTLGLRSSLFLPFEQLGLIIIDEEHEPSYRQQDPAPRYHARNAALMLASMHGAKALLGSATPSLESCLNAHTGKYGLVTLKERYCTGAAPLIHVVNVKELKRWKQMKNPLFSPFLIEKMGDALAQGEQVILFRNRRGFAPVMECNACGNAIRCVHCDVSLTYHKRASRLACHYCGYAIPLPLQCPSCGAEAMRLAGFGTEQVEEETATLFPDAKIARLDFDTAHTHNAFRRILSDFEQGKTQILIGTQMASKGLDFDRVSVAGILNADSLMNVPDFRAHERAFQLMMQVGGRAGRREKQGIVVIQTSQPEHPLLQMVRQGDYDGMVRLQLDERRMFRYPPYYRIITLVFRGRDEQMLTQFSATYAEALREDFGGRVYGPFSPSVSRIQALFLRQIVLKLERRLSPVTVRVTLDKIRKKMQFMSDAQQVRIHYDVDN